MADSKTAAPAPPAGASPTVKSRAGLYGILVLLGAFLPYLGVLRQPLVYDSIYLITDGDVVQSVRHAEGSWLDFDSGLYEPFRENYWAGVMQGRGPQGQALYRPLTVWSWAVTERLGDGSPMWHHLLNLLLHGITSVLVFRLALALLRREGWALAVGLLFATHPIHTEAVTYVTGRSEVLSTLLVVAAWLGHVTMEHRRGAGKLVVYVLSLLAFFLALLAKEGVATFPAALLLGDLAFGLRRRNRGAGGGQVGGGQAAGGETGEPPRVAEVLRRLPVYLGYAIPLGLNLWVRSRVLPSLIPESRWIWELDNPLVHQSFLPRLFTAFKVMLREIWLLVFPYSLSADYSLHQIPVSQTLLDPPAFFSFVILAAVITAGILAWRKMPVLFFAVGFFFVSIFVTSNIPRAIGTIFGERLLYFPSIAIVVLAGAAFGRLWDRLGKSSRWVAIAPVLLIVGLFSARTVARNRDWRDDFILWEKTIQTSPQSARAHFNYASFCMKKKFTSLAIQHYKETLEIYPDFFPASLALGDIYLQQNLDADALRTFQESLPKVPLGASMLGGPLERIVKARQKMGQYREAVTDIQRVVARLRTSKDPELDPKPDLAAALLVLGQAYRGVGDVDGQLGALKEAVDLMPGEWKVQHAYGAALSEANRLDDAEPALLAALRLAPDEAEVHLSLARYRYKRGEVEDSEHEFRETIRLNPKSLPAKIGLASLLKIHGDRQEALDLLAEVRESRPDLPTVRLQAAEIFAEMDEVDSAIQEVEAFLAVQPDSFQGLAFLAKLEQKAGKAAKAEAHFREALEKVPGEPEVTAFLSEILLGRAGAAKASGDEAGAKAALDECQTILEGALLGQPMLSDLLNNLGQVYAMRGEYEDAIVLFRDSIAVEERYEGFYNLALSYFNLERYRDAVEPLKKVEELRPTFPYSYQFLSRIHAMPELEDIYDPEQARKEASKALEIEPKNGWFLLSLGRAYVRLEKWAEAVPALEGALENLAASEEKDRDEAQALLGEARAHTG